MDKKNKSKNVPLKDRKHESVLMLGEGILRSYPGSPLWWMSNMEKEEWILTEGMKAPEL